MSVQLSTPVDLADVLYRRDLIARVDRGALTAAEAMTLLGIRPISGGAFPVTVTKTQVASTDSPANAPTVWNTNVFQALEDLFGIPDALAVNRALLRSVLAGCTLSNDGTSPNTVIDVAAGIGMSSDQLLCMEIGAFTGSTGGIWATGSGGNKMDTSTAVAQNTWYHVFLIGGGGNTTDILFSTSATAPTLPTGYTKQRRIGSFKTATGSTNILTFVQSGDYFRWLASILDVNSTNPGTSAVTRTLTVPTNVIVWALLNVQANSQTAGGGTYLSDLAANDEAPSTSAAPLSSIFSPAVASIITSGQVVIRTNTSAQIRSRASGSDASTTLLIATLGWYDRRGQDA